MSYTCSDTARDAQGFASLHSLNSLGACLTLFGSSLRHLPNSLAVAALAVVSPPNDVR